MAIKQRKTYITTSQGSLRNIHFNNTVSCTCFYCIHPNGESTDTLYSNYYKFCIMKTVILQKPCNIDVDIFIISKNELKNPEKLIVRFWFKTSLSSNSCSPFCPSLYYPSFLYTLPTLNVFLTLFMTSTVELRSQT